MNERNIRILICSFFIPFVCYCWGMVAYSAYEVMYKHHLGWFIMTMNKPVLAKSLLERDIDRVKEEMVVVSASGSEWLWEPFADDLKKLVADGATITFIVGPDFAASNHKTISELAALPGVEVFEVSKQPRVDLRLVDNKHVYLARRGFEEGLKRNCLYSQPGGAPPEELKAIEQFLEGLSSQAKSLFLSI